MRPSAAITAVMLSLGLAAGGDPDAHERVDAMIRGVKTPAGQAKVLLRVGYLDPDEDEEVVAAARRKLSVYTGTHIIAPLHTAYREASVEVRRDLIDLAGETYTRIKGKSPQYQAVIRSALLDEDPYIRHAALDQAGRHNVTRMALTVADVFYFYPQDRIAALDTLGLLKDRRGIQPAFDALESDDEALREAAVRNLARIGRAAGVALKQRMLDERAPVAKDAARALLGFASEQDLPALYQFAERFAATDEELGKRLTRAIAQIEIGKYRPPPPEDL
jgi:HEAT repeat protein